MDDEQTTQEMWVGDKHRLPRGISILFFTITGHRNPRSFSVNNLKKYSLKDDNKAISHEVFTIIVQ